MSDGPISAILVNLDGTSASGAGELSPRAMRAVKLLQQRGVLFAITSAQPPMRLRMLVEPLGMNVLMAAFDGALVFLPDLTIIDERTIPDRIAPAVADTIRMHGLEVWLYRAAQWYLTDPRTPLAEAEARAVQFAPMVVAGYRGLLDRAIKIVGVSDDPNRVARCEEAIRRRFGAQVSIARPRPSRLDLTNPTANKGVVIERLSIRFKIPLGQIAAIGDQISDAPMFARSGLSIAMGNASEDVQRLATQVSTTAEDDGFATAVERFVLPRLARVP